MRIVVAKRTSRRGEGLGNELLPWAKGWIASQALGAHLVGPSWGLNKRRYARNFRTDPLDWLLEDTLLRLPHLSFTEADYRATGETDFGAAIGQWAQQRELDRRKSFLVSVAGMGGGYAAIRHARPFLWSRLSSSSDAQRNVYQVLSVVDRSKLFVAVHLRSSAAGFATPKPNDSMRGKFNIVVPSEWILWVCGEIERAFHNRVQFWFFTDRRSDGFDKTVQRFNPEQIAQHGLTECSDLLLMAMADLRVCSVSSYSMAACFLGNGPYVWYGPQLTLRDGLYSLWGDEEAQQGRSPTARSAEFVAEPNASSEAHKPQACFPGWPMGTGDPLPERLAELLEQKLRAKDPRTNLLEYGCVPAGSLRASLAF